MGDLRVGDRSVCVLVGMLGLAGLCGCVRAAAPIAAPLTTAARAPSCDALIGRSVDSFGDLVGCTVDGQLHNLSEIICHDRTRVIVVQGRTEREQYWAAPHGLLRHTDDMLNDSDYEPDFKACQR